ncbi:BTAD domain-containing putative transcriptional regulator [Kribbella solani]|uniref:BTAD domain-containing putative transcriptional regulator n=1 Tax=Kribbella solani TaxID=236067 RepID=UPI0029BD7CD1|nr:BTAD domain-containing putative transcriptional regulator [Kribbella solani]MDX2973707.1 BTAD domain-containing putative transcriptional regulator [Kribbella solani]
MSRTPSPERFLQAETAPHRERSIGRALLAAVALLVLVAGVPAALIAFTGPPPFPHSWPDRDTLTSPIGVDTLLTVLTFVVWLAWLHFVACVAAELSSAVRGRGVPRSIPLGGGSQRIARVLVSALIVTGIAAGQASALTTAHEPTPQPTHSVSATHQTTATPQEKPAVAHVTSNNPLAGKKVYVVKAPHAHRHDSLWDIADKHLGDGRRYTEIYELNKERAQPDGQRLHLARLIMPGWNLIMPEDAVGVSRVPIEHVPEQRTEEKPPKHTTEVHPRVRVDDHGSQAGHAEQADHGDHAGQADGGAGVAQTDTRFRLPSDLLGGGLLTAGLLALLLIERRRRRGSDPDQAATTAEVAIRVGGDPSRSIALDHALRALGGSCEASGVPLPPIFAVLVDDEWIELLLAPAQGKAPAPWHDLDDGRRWRIARAAVGPDTGGPAPYPALVCLGRDEDGRDVLVDLEAASGAVSIHGDAVVAREVANSVAVQLATNPWADLLEVTAWSLPDGLDEILSDRLRVVRDLDALLPELEQADAEPGVLTGQVSRSMDEIPQYVVLGAPPGDDAATRLAALAGRRSSGFGLLVAGPVPGARWQLFADESGVLRIPALDLIVRASRLTEKSLDLVTDLLASARSTAAADPAGQVRVPQSGRAGDDSSWVTANVRVGVLGRLDIRSPRMIEPARLPLATEVATFLALHPGGVHPSVLAASVWPGGVTTEVRDATVQRVREWLGTDSQGAHQLRIDATGRLYLGSEVAVDWDCFCELIRRSRTAQTTRDERELLRRAMHLVRGQFLSDRVPGTYSWLARVHLERLIPDLVIHAAHRLAELSIGDDDPAGAANAARAGLRLAVSSERLWQDLLVAEYRRGGHAAAEQVVHLLGEAAQAQGLTPSAETESLIEELLPGRTTVRRVG